MTFRDPASIAGSHLQIDERTTLLVIGAGPAGLAAAIAAAQANTQVILVDENPIPAETMADDIPHYFGARYTGAARNRAAMTEAFIASDPQIEQAFDAGVDLRLNTVCWGLYAPNQTSPTPTAGLHDGTRSWLVAADRIIVATGRRDMALAFDNWAQPGVMGMEAAIRLATRYNALDVRRAVILGTTTEAILGATLLATHGVTIAAIIEPGPTPLEPSTHTILTNHTIRRAETGPDGVTAAIVDGPNGETRIPCDTIITAIATIPLIELLDSATCRTTNDPARGGPIPLIDNTGQTSIPTIAAAGDCTGIWPAKSRNPQIAAAEGRTAALALPAEAPPPDPTAPNYRLDWVRTALLSAKSDPHVCQCEEVTAREILEIRPPRYLAAPPDRRNTHTLESMLGNSPPNPDQVKRLTRAGMGLCQGRRCRDQVACLLALASNTPLEEIPLATHRAPIRPIPLRLAAATTEDAGIARHWDVWFAMKSQYQAPWNLPEHYTAATRNQGQEGSE